MRTKQDVFDQVALHLLQQGQKSIDSSDCLYRGPNGLKCAAGVLIPDELYDESFEQHDWFGVILGCTDDANFMNIEAVGKLRRHLHDEGLDESDMMNFVHKLQGMHDTVSPSMWPQSLRSFAVIEGLSTSTIDEFILKKENTRA